MRLVTVARPTPGAGEVLVKIFASGVNPLDAKICDGSAAQSKVQLPTILGLDLAGVIETVGSGVTRFQPGDKVFGMTGGVGAVKGSLAEYAVVDADLLALKPACLNWREAAALPMVFLTAWEGLVDQAKVDAREKVLVSGGAGGVGQIVVQVALAHGAEVFATDSALRLQRISSLGATPVNYETTSMAQCVTQFTAGQGFDVIYDTVGGATLDAALDSVRPYCGRVVSCTGWGVHKLAALSLRNASFSGVFTLRPLLSGEGRAHHGDILAEAAKLAQAGKLQPTLDPHVFNLETAHDAHALIASGQACGKVVVEIISDAALQ
jgi:NADPH:quinone reductase-like Zn-dependent oxidoreductase